MTDLVREKLKTGDAQVVWLFSLPLFFMVKTIKFNANSAEFLHSFITCTGSFKSAAHCTASESKYTILLC